MSYFSSIACCVMPKETIARRSFGSVVFVVGFNPNQDWLLSKLCVYVALPPIKKLIGEQIFHPRANECK